MNCKVCHNLSVKNPNLSFFRFPSDYNRCRDWAKRCGLLPVFDKHGPGKFYKSFRICSEHFESKHVTFDGKKKKLLSGAVPIEFHMNEGVAEIVDDSKNTNLRPKPTVCLISKQFRNLCRFCAEEGPKLTDIFSWRGKTLKLEEKIKVFPIRIDRQDELPLKICRRCIFKIGKFYEFVNSCLKADVKLKKILGFYQHKIFGSNSKTREKLKLADAIKIDKGKSVIHQDSNTAFDTTQNQENNLSVKENKTPGLLKPRFFYLRTSALQQHTQSQMHDNKETEKFQCNNDGKVSKSYSGEDEVSDIKMDYSNKEPIEDKTTTNIIQREYEKLNLNKYTCSKCSKHFCNSEILESHAKAHSLEPDEQGRFICQTCDKVFPNKYRLNEHNRVHTGEYPFKCSVCSKRFHKGALLRQHSLIHESGKRYACSVCDLRSSRKGNLIQHLKNHYKKLQNENPDAKLNEQAYLVTEETADFKRRRLLTESLNTASVPTEERPPVVDSKIDDGTQHAFKFMCGLCQKQFLDLGSIEEHFRLFTCENLKSSNDQTELNASENRSDQKTAESKKSNKRTGRKIKGNERNFQCEECGLKFKRKDTLTNHFRIHTGERPYMCKICGFTFKQRGDCLKHERNHSKDDDFL